MKKGKFSLPSLHGIDSTSLEKEQGFIPEIILSILQIEQDDLISWPPRSTDTYLDFFFFFISECIKINIHNEEIININLLKHPIIIAIETSPPRLRDSEHTRED